jgi:hypothetical protein
MSDEQERRFQRNSVLERCLFLSIALVYFFRLPMAGESDGDSDLRAEFLKWGAFGNGKGSHFQMTIDGYLRRFVNRDNFAVPAAIALNQALKENVFAIVACTQTSVPLGIIGSPGSSKTLAYHIVRDNLLGPNNSPKEFCKKFDKLDTFFYQCSRYSTASDIRGVFDTAEKRQEQYDETAADTGAGHKTRCVVFLDEAGLPPEGRNVLKVLHSPLDNRKVAFVCISNRMFDAANANRMVKVFRSRSTLDDLVTLACGCAGVDETEQEHHSRTMKIIVGICAGYLDMLSPGSDPRFFKMFHYRDLIYLFRSVPA